MNICILFTHGQMNSVYLVYDLCGISLENEGCCVFIKVEIREKGRPYSNVSQGVFRIQSKCLLANNSIYNFHLKSLALLITTEKLLWSFFEV